MEIKTDHCLELFESKEHEYIVSCNVYNMQTELQVSLPSESRLHPENISVQNGDLDVTSSTANYVQPKKPGMLLFKYILLLIIGELENLRPWDVESPTFDCYITA